MHPDWVRDLRDRCADAGVPFFFKQWGAWHYGSTMNGANRVVANDGTTYAWEEWKRTAHRLTSGVRSSATYMSRVGKKAAGRELDGRTHDEFPEVAA